MLNDAAIVADPADTVVIENVALVAPAATVTLDGTVATAVLLLDSDTAAPPVGAPAESVTVPTAAVPTVTLAALRPTVVTVGVVDVGVGVGALELPPHCTMDRTAATAATASRVAFTRCPAGRYGLLTMFMIATPV